MLQVSNALNSRWSGLVYAYGAVSMYLDLVNATLIDFLLRYKFFTVFKSIIKVFW